MGDIIGKFLRQSRAMFLTCTVVPVCLGGVLAYHDTGMFSWTMFLLTLFGVSVAHLGVNLTNDYYDFKFGADQVEQEEKPFSGGGGAITREGENPAKIKAMFWGCFGVALLIGIIILYLMDSGRGIILSMMVLGFFGGYFYTAPPFRFAYRGLGELDIFIFLGPAPVLGTYAVLTGTLSWTALVCSLPIAGLITALLWINEYTDFVTDKEAGKKNLVVRLGRKRARWGYVALVTGVFVAVILPVAFQKVEATFLIGLLPLPFAIRSVKTAINHFDDSSKIAFAQADFLKAHLFVGLLCSVGVYAGTLL